MNGATVIPTARIVWNYDPISRGLKPGVDLVGEVRQ